MIYVTTKTTEYEKQAKECWHRWFAWYPVTVKEYPDGAERKVWLQTVDRKGTCTYDWEGRWWTFEYRLYQRSMK